MDRCYAHAAYTGEALQARVRMLRIRAAPWTLAGRSLGQVGGRRTECAAAALQLGSHFMCLFLCDRE